MTGLHEGLKSVRERAPALWVEEGRRPPVRPPSHQPRQNARRFQPRASDSATRKPGWSGSGRAECEENASYREFERRCWLGLPARLERACRRSTALISLAVSGHSLRHARQHQVRTVTPWTMVISGLTVPRAPQNLHRAGSWKGRAEGTFDLPGNDGSGTAHPPRAFASRSHRLSRCHSGKSDEGLRDHPDVGGRKDTNTDGCQERGESA